MNNKRMNRIEQMKQAETNCRNIIVMNSIEQRIAARTSGMEVLKACIEKCKAIGDEVRAKEFYSKALEMGEEIKQLYIQLDNI